MKTIKLFIMANCPYCRQALGFLEELKTTGKYDAINVEIIDELVDRHLADTYDYYYVPSIFYQEKKVHEGVLTLEGLMEILDSIINDEE